MEERQMKYVTYYEAVKLISAEEAARLKDKLEITNGTGTVKHLKIRKVNFIVSGGNPSYCICMTNDDYDTMLLSKRAVQNMITYRNYTSVARGECARILEGRIDWMEDSEVELFRDFCLQYRLNRIKQGFIEEYDRELITYANGHKLVIDSSRRHAMGHGTDFLYPELWMENLPADTVRAEYRKAVEIPPMIAGMIHMAKDTNQEVLAVS